MTIPKLKICEPVVTTDDIKELCVRIEKLERRVEEEKEEIAQLREQVRLIRMILDGNGIEY